MSEKSLLSKLNQIADLEKVASSVQVFDETYNLFRLSFDKRKSNLFAFMALKKNGQKTPSASDKLFDLDTGNSLWPGSAPCQYMTFNIDYRISGPYIAKIFLQEYEKKVLYHRHCHFIQGDDDVDTFRIGGNTLRKKNSPKQNESEIEISLSKQDELLCLRGHIWKVDQYVVGL